MGMYTGLRFEAKLKPFVSDAICLIFKTTGGYGEFWQSLSRIIPINESWMQHDRCDYIPYGALSYMPKDWVSSNVIDSKSKVWTVCCSLKDYNNEIDDFLRKVLPFLIDEPCEVEELYEEWKAPRIHLISPQPMEEMSV